MSSITRHSKDLPSTIFESPTFDQDLRIRVNEAVGSASISPSGRDVVLASQQGLHIIDLDAPYSPPRHLRHQTPWTPADVQWSPFASRYYWVVSTSNQRALVWNLESSSTQAPIEHVLHAHSRAITDINFSAFHPDILATCAVDSFVHCWDLRTPARPAVSFSDWYAGATQVKWNRQDPHILASSHDRFLRIWDDRKGAIPLVTIDAHSTKIYGLDWNRTSPTKIITCSLDRTIKIWDYAVSEVAPKRIIRTPFPVWRARHTPFGWGVLAMPQSGDDKLHLYHRRMDENTPWDAEIEPTYSFKGHRDQVKEFLWRARGLIQDERDNRDFQLISWGADRELILHRMREKTLKPVGFEKGMQIDKPFNLTRRGSPYKSFREAPETSPLGVLHAATIEPTTEKQGAQVVAAGSPDMSRGHIPAAWRSNHGGTAMTRAALQSRETGKPNNNLLTWMKGVRFGKRGANTSRKHRPRASLIGEGLGSKNPSETLKDEIIQIGERFKKVNIEDADLSSRYIKLSMNTARGMGKQAVYLQIEMFFPSEYPAAPPVSFRLERPSSMSEEDHARLESELVQLMEACAGHRFGCLEIAVSLLIGEQDLEQCIRWLAEDDELDAVGSDSSSDEEVGAADFANAGSHILEPDGSSEPNLLSNNAKVPLPKGCGALWAPNGQLVCFFPPKEEPPSLLDNILSSNQRSKDDNTVFAGFGRLRADSPEPRPHERIEEEDVDDESDGWQTSSSSSSDASEGIDAFPVRFYPPKAWQQASLRFRKMRSNSGNASQPTSTGAGRSSNSTKQKTVISIHSLVDILPAKRSLANEYIVFGDGPTVCSHNAGVARQHGCNDIADIWDLAGLLLCSTVPLDRLEIPHAQSSFLVLARRALVSIRRIDSGLDLSFDEPENVYNPLCTGLVKWGSHPFAGDWLIREMFDHFEQLADIQMLAMLSCIMAQRSLPYNNDQARDPSVQWPASSVPYLPFAGAATGLSGPVISVSASPETRYQSFGTYGSRGSSEGNQILLGNSEPGTPFSTSSTPPLGLSRTETRRSSAVQNLSVSPEQKTVPQSAASSFAASVWSRPFQLSHSPPTRHLPQPEESFSMSTPSSGSVTWGPTTIHGSDSTIRRSFLAQELADNDDGSSTDDDEAQLPDVGVKVRLHNQHMFDDEAHVDRPFLSTDAAKFANYRAVYAEMLEAWGLNMQRNEVLMFNVQPRKRLRSQQSQTTLTLDTLMQGEEIAPDAEAVLSVVRCCLSCGQPLPKSRPDTRCTSCGAQARLLLCSICAEPIGSLYKVCVDCGHVAHTNCQLDFLASSADEPVCDSGCGCWCSNDLAAGEETSRLKSRGLAED